MIRPPRNARLAAVLLAPLVFGSCRTLTFPGLPKAPVLAEWVQITVTGQPAVRAITEGPCPSLEVDGAPVVMRVRAEPSSDYPVRVCEAVIAPRSVALLEGRRLPTFDPDAATPLAVLGDTGCRIKNDHKFGWMVQDCADPAKWPFPEIAKRAAAAKPGFVVHMGDYLYREHCPEGSIDARNCPAIPRGYNWATWNVDFFEPARPLLGAAPWLFARGNHEACGRAADGWRRFLDPGIFDPDAGCDPYGPPFRVPLKGLTLVSMDSTCATDDVGDSPATACGSLDQQVARFTQWFEPQLFDGSRTWLITHKPVWALANADDASPRTRNVVLQRAMAKAAPKNVELAIGGHVHLFESVLMEGRGPSQIVLGNGGTSLDGRTPLLALDGRVINEVKLAKGFASARWGYALARPEEETDTLQAFDWRGEAVATCAIAKGATSCTANAPAIPAK